MMKKLQIVLAASACAVGLLGASQAMGATINIPAGQVVNLNWTTGNEYILQGFCYVLPPDVLNIQPGVVVKGVPGASTNDFGVLFICNGAQINAVGTAAQPIIFTAQADNVNDPADIPFAGTAPASPAGRGLWGGLVILGDAQINSALDNVGQAAVPKYEIYEGLPDTVINGVNVHRFGGADDLDDSGTLRYVSIRHGGKFLLLNKEINGLSLGAVGSGTEIDFVEVYAFADDGIELWGGTVNTKHLVLAHNDDDSFDADAGWRGHNQFLFAIQYKDKRDDIGELNGQLTERAGLPATAPFSEYQIRNATFIGPGNGSGGVNNDVHNVRVYNRCRWYNSIFLETSNGRLRINTDSPGAPCPLSAAPFALTGVEYHGNLWFNTTATDFGAGGTFFAAPWDNQVIDPELVGISWIPDYGLDPTLAAGSPALGGVVVPPVVPFYAITTYKGAFGANDHWMDGWTYLWERGFLDISFNTVYAPATDTTTVSCRSVVGVNYQFQSSTDGVVWVDVGPLTAGTGGTISINVVPTPAGAIYRVRRG